MPVPTYGAAELSRSEAAPSAFQVAPPSVDRWSSSEGRRRSSVVTSTADGCCGSTASPAQP
ncbi:hypothetical protein ACGFZP_27785 [Kitasatospora sp. NPDC048239]|uniref:hypothetical protein n=1 Tax=Kitasatospora sp. NPDC048239 TaxID=3364046 RepID=UPI00371D1AD3